jgi:hypothetical protein
MDHDPSRPLRPNDGPAKRRLRFWPRNSRAQALLLVLGSLAIPAALGAAALLSAAPEEAGKSERAETPLTGTPLASPRSTVGDPPEEALDHVQSAFSYCQKVVAAAAEDLIDPNLPIESRPEVGPIIKNIFTTCLAGATAGYSGPGQINMENGVPIARADGDSPQESPESEAQSDESSRTEAPRVEGLGEECVEMELESGTLISNVSVVGEDCSAAEKLVDEWVSTGDFGTQGFECQSVDDDGIVLCVRVDEEIRFSVQYGNDGSE